MPIPSNLAAEYWLSLPRHQGLLWQEFERPITRIKTYRWIKALISDAGISGPKACPKGLRHAFGVRAIMAGVPLHMVQKWLGHASPRTTAIYTTVLSHEQLELSDRMWGG